MITLNEIDIPDLVSKLELAKKTTEELILIEEEVLSQLEETVSKMREEAVSYIESINKSLKCPSYFSTMRSLLTTHKTTSDLIKDWNTKHSFSKLVIDTRGQAELVLHYPPYTNALKELKRLRSNKATFVYMLSKARKSYELLAKFNGNNSVSFSDSSMFKLLTIIKQYH